MTPLEFQKRMDEIIRNSLVNYDGTNLKECRVGTVNQLLHLFREVVKSNLLAEEDGTPRAIDEVVKVNNRVCFKILSSLPQESER